MNIRVGVKRNELNNKMSYEYGPACTTQRSAFSQPPYTAKTRPKIQNICHPIKLYNKKN